MANWFHRFFNPHCPHCLNETIESRICASCEVLRAEVARLRADNERLLSRVLEKPEVIKDREIAPAPQAVLPKSIPWAVRRQMLEAEDREKAKLIRNAAKPDSVEDLEKEMGIVEENRNASK
jgi:hypothetical protein